MTNLNSSTYLGNPIIVDGNAYEYQGELPGVPTSIGTIDYTNISDQTYNNADLQGKSYYSATERALASYEFGPRGYQFNSADYAGPITYIFGLYNRAPTSDDDTTDGWQSNAHWLDASTGKLYVCSDITEGAAVWTWRNTGGTLQPCDGVVFRGWGGASNDFYVNGKRVIYLNGNINVSEDDSSPINVGPGDKVGGLRRSVFWGNYLNFNVLPFNFI